ncbi:protein phosphatase 2C 50-like [Henckelia pumila]|uniref:protein phosphatase 2C 50-like n=1 Tax=Henckelia pumila TaxID=405737 RepID=UPI003C6E2558
MGEITPVISVSFKLGSLINEDSVLTTCVDITGIELISNAKSLLLEVEPSMTKLPVSIEHITFTSSVPQDGVVTVNVSNFDEMSICEADLLTMSGEDEGRVVLSDPSNQELRTSGLIPFDHDSISTIIDCGLESNETNMPIDECKVLEVVSSPIELDFLDKDCNGSGNINSSDSGESMMESVVVNDLVLVGENGEAMVVLDLSTRISESIFEVSQETKIHKHNSPPLWGLVSIQGRRPEMEDSAVALPRCLRIPSQMFSDNPHLCSSDQDFTAHLFGVYDGHGGSQVANYCKERLHIALTEEIDKSKQNFHDNYVGYSWKEQWMKIFLDCFQKLDDEVGGTPESNGDITINTPVVPPIAPDSVGSTAVVAIVCSTQIIVANCGDSRAVLCRGKVAVPLSTDHKPQREDEFKRIDALGGKVINWNGYRVSGVLAASRSIGDRYLSPYVISDPDITFHPRAKEDECLILASDGLWDVMTNEEACDLARRRILLWHKRNGGSTLPKEIGEDTDPAAQDAANYLSQVAFQRGSIDNISVIVVDLKAQRKVKKKMV